MNTTQIFFQVLFSISSTKKAQYELRVQKAGYNFKTIAQCATTPSRSRCKYTFTVFVILGNDNVIRILTYNTVQNKTCSA